MQDDVSETLEFCGLEGDQTEAPLRVEVNRFIRRAMIYHITPVKKQVNEVHAALYDPDNGIIPALKTIRTIRRWICIGATWAATLVLAGLELLDKLHGMGIL